MHTYEGLLAKIFSSSESESGGKSQIFLGNSSSECFFSDIGHLILHKRLIRNIKPHFSHVKELPELILESGNVTNQCINK